jgi:hypothetical protein
MKLAGSSRKGKPLGAINRFLSALVGCTIEWLHRGKVS